MECTPNQQEEGVSREMEIDEPSRTGLLEEQEEGQVSPSFGERPPPQQDTDGQAATHEDQNFIPMEMLKSTCNLGAHVLALSTLLVVNLWIHRLGGLSWKDGEVRNDRLFGIRAYFENISHHPRQTKRRPNWFSIGIRYSWLQLFAS